MAHIEEQRQTDDFTKFFLIGPWPFHPAIHKFTAPDHGDPHDHPWAFRSIILHGGYVEEVFDIESGTSERIARRPGDSFMNDAGKIHRIVELLDGDCFTIVLPHACERQPGFYRFGADGYEHRFWHEPDFSRSTPYIGSVDRANEAPAQPDLQAEVDRLTRDLSKASYRIAYSDAFRVSAIRNFVRAEEAEAKLADALASQARMRKAVKLTLRDAAYHLSKYRPHVLTALTNAALASSPETGTEGDLVSYIKRQWSWSLETFGPALRTKGVIDHIRKELGEIEREPHDLSEWVDVIILAMDGFWRHGGKPEDLLPRMQAKQDKNFARQWPDWRTMSEDTAIEHDRAGEKQAAALAAGAVRDPAPGRDIHQPIETAPRDGTPIRLFFGSHTATAGWWSGLGGYPWSFIDTGLVGDGTGINRARDGEYGPSHWAPFDVPAPYAPDELAKLRERVEAEARRYAGMYPEASDGRNTFVLFAEWVAALSPAHEADRTDPPKREWWEDRLPRGGETEAEAITRLHQSPGYGGSLEDARAAVWSAMDFANAKRTADRTEIEGEPR